MRNQRVLSFPGSLALAVLTSAVLAACGGGGDGSQPAAQSTTTATGAPVTQTPADPAAKPTSVVTPACSGCAAVDDNT